MWILRSYTIQQMVYNDDVLAERWAEMYSIVQQMLYIIVTDSCISCFVS